MDEETANQTARFLTSNWVGKNGIHTINVEAECDHPDNEEFYVVVYVDKKKLKKTKQGLSWTTQLFVSFIEFRALTKAT